MNYLQKGLNMSIRISSQQSQVLVVDIQAGLVPHLHDHETMLKQSVRVLTAAQLFKIPITVAEQYPKGLGHSVNAIQGFISESVFVKTSFSCFGSKELREHIKRLKSAGHTTLVVIGCEAHVCVLQTVIDSLEQGFRVVVVDDAVTSRNKRDIELTCVRLSNAGAEYVSTEMLLFEWTQSKDTAQFKQILALLK
jgi:nicotinamidase-related amidase